jgi:hypothetical protein
MFWIIFWLVIAPSIVVLALTLPFFNWSLFRTIMCGVNDRIVESLGKKSYYFDTHWEGAIQTFHGTLFRCNFPLLGNIALCWARLTNSGEEYYIFNGIHWRRECGILRLTKNVWYLDEDCEV